MAVSLILRSDCNKAKSRILFCCLDLLETLQSIEGIAACLKTAMPHLRGLDNPNSGPRANAFAPAAGFAIAGSEGVRDTAASRTVLASRLALPHRSS